MAKFHSSESANWQRSRLKPGTRVTVPRGHADYDKRSRATVIAHVPGMQLVKVMLDDGRIFRVPWVVVRGVKGGR